MHYDYNYLCIPTNAHTLYKITVYIYMNSPTCFSNNSRPQRGVNAKEYKSNKYQIHIRNFKGK
jgi:hypothetical protein